MFYWCLNIGVSNESLTLRRMCFWHQPVGGRSFWHIAIFGTLFLRLLPFWHTRKYGIGHFGIFTLSPAYTSLYFQLPLAPFFLLNEPLLFLCVGHVGRLLRLWLLLTSILEFVKTVRGNPKMTLFQNGWGSTSRRQSVMCQTVWIPSQTPQNIQSSDSLYHQYFIELWDTKTNAAPGERHVIVQCIILFKTIFVTFRSRGKST